MYDLYMKDTNIDNVNVSKLVEIIYKLSDGGRTWSPKIRSIIQREESSVQSSNLQLFFYLLQLQQSRFHSGNGSKVDLQLLIEDFEYSKVLNIGDSMIASKIASIRDRGFNREFQCFIFQFIETYIDCIKSQ